MSLLIARQGDNRTINDFKTMYDYATDPFKTKDRHFVYNFGAVTDDPFAEMLAVKTIFGKTGGRQYTQMILSPTPIGNEISDEDFFEMSKEIAIPIYENGFHCTITVHFDTGKRHLHLLQNCVSFVDGHKFSQSISQLNRFKLHCNKVLTKYGFDPICRATEMIEDKKEYSFADGYDFLEAYAEIAEDIAFNFYNICEAPPAPTVKTPAISYNSKYDNPDWPREGGYNHFFAANCPGYQEAWDILSSIGNNYCRDTTFDNAFSPPSECVPISPFSPADFTPAIIVRDSSPQTVAYDESEYGSGLFIDYSKHYDIHVPETIPPDEVESIMKKVPLMTEKQKNDAIKSASAAKHALEHRGNNSKVILDLSEKVALHFNKGNNDSPDIIDVEFHDSTDANN